MILEQNIVDILRDNGHNDIAEQITQLQKIINAKGEYINPDSLHQFGLFIMDRNALTPEVRISSDGLIQAVWINDYGSLTIDFLTTGYIKFLILPKTSQVQQQKVSGIISENDIEFYTGKFANMFKTNSQRKLDV